MGLADGPNAFKVHPRNIILDQRVKIKFVAVVVIGRDLRMNIKFNYTYFRVFGSFA